MLFSLSPKLRGQAEAEEAVCAVRCVFLITLSCLSRHAHPLPPPGTFPRLGDFGWKAGKGNPLWKEGEGNVFRSSSPEDSLYTIRFMMSVSKSRLGGNERGGSGALPQESTGLPSEVKKLDSECR